MLHWRPQIVRDLFLDLQPCDALSMLSKMLQVAIAITSADKGNIQILNPLSRTLRIAVSDGFAEPFLQYFDEVNHRTAACGTAMKRLERVVVEDIRQSPLFVGTEALQVLLEEDVQAVQSTPLLTKDKYIVGMISTHYRVPTLPTREQLQLLDELAEISAEFIVSNSLGQSALSPHNKERVCHLTNFPPRTHLDRKM